MLAYSPTETAEMLVLDNDYDTAVNIHTWAWQNTIYTPAARIKSLRIFWRDMVGDCSEVAIATCAMAKQVGIASKKVYGKAYMTDGTITRHAWCEFSIDGKWINFENQSENIIRVKKIAYGEN